MKNTFEILETFLERSRGEVSGRAAEQIPQDVVDRARAFAQGRTNSRDRAELAALLKERPEWTSLLARQILEQRAQSGSSAS